MVVVVVEPPESDDDDRHLEKVIPQAAKTMNRIRTRNTMQSTAWCVWTGGWVVLGSVSGREEKNFFLGGGLSGRKGLASGGAGITT